MNIVITGASSGFGRAIATLFASKGHQLFLCARRIERLQELKFTLEKQYNISAKIYALDVRDKDAVQAWAEKLKKDFYNKLIFQCCD